ncbi:primosomal protein N' [Candidatus Venteria ishoeyi]|uniref:primosomal protein N' n=1 Tax=Candidatus Venteria ishoeyi TaxID=1899563 RepID=UPI0025A59A3C|nr:primosomal protein N' [Candidatus Venteria ishoeyi]MDM8546953.1 primosomal protein N' [Candidatus Venteria ishoeyi]
MPVICTDTILQLAIPCPLPGLFDYLPPPQAASDNWQAGMRLRVPFGSSTRTGVLIKVATHTQVALDKLRAAEVVLDDKPVIPTDILKLAQWAANYYHHPLGQVLETLLPSLLNRGEVAALPDLPGWCATEKGRESQIDSLPKRALRQRALLQCLQQYPEGLSNAMIQLAAPTPPATLKRLEQQGLIQAKRFAKPLHSLLNTHNDTTQSKTVALALNAAQQAAVDEVCGALGQFQAYLLDGVTGSGKTEVYLQIIQHVIAQGQQALLLVPEINLTPQMLSRFTRRFDVPIAILHSRLTDKERLSAWLMARDGLAPIVIGTRSAAWTPLLRPAVFIIDEEHDNSYKQQGGLHYSARDLTVMRAHQTACPVLLGTATPALDTLYNSQQQRYQRLHLPERAGGAKPPDYKLIDLRVHKTYDGLSQPLVKAIQTRLDLGQQSLIYINRRGYAPTVMCHDCGWVAECRHCSAHLTYHAHNKQLACHHCGMVIALPRHCPSCQKTALRCLGQGTQRLEQSLQGYFPKARILRIDSDTTRGKHNMENLLEQVHSGKVDILVGTQMLAKGHHFPNVTLVGVINMDGGLFGVDFRAGERVAQALIQVAGRAGRAELPGEVLVQSYHPDHPLLQALLKQGYGAFADTALAERSEAELPPYTYLALLRAQHRDENNLQAFLSHAMNQASAVTTSNPVELFGPLPAPLSRRADLHRAQLLIQTRQRAALHHLLQQWLPQLTDNPHRKGIQWMLDVDPQDLF